MYVVIYEPMAEEDLIAILTYYAEQGGTVLAETIFARIKTHIDRLEIFPYRTVESDAIPDTRELIIEKLPYKAYIHVVEASKTVYVLRILHMARKVP